MIMGSIVVNTLREAFRRKQAWVLLIITGVVMGCASMINVFDMEQQTTFAKLTPLIVIPFVTMVLSTFVAARQLPTEIRERTLYPLLAKPIRRWQWLLAKYIGVVLISWIIIAVLFAVFQVLIWVKGIEVNAFLYQGLLLLMLQIAIYDALVMMFTVILHADATICLGILVFIGSYLFEGPLWAAVEGAKTAFDKILLGGLYWIFPQFKLFDVTRAIRFNWDPTPITDLFPFVLYSLCLIVAYLALGSLRLESKDL